jgi:hypothetical protein
MKSTILQQIKPAFPDLVKYSHPGSPSVFIPDSQQLNETSFSEDEARPVDLKKKRAWGNELRRAADAASVPIVA